MAKNFLRIFPAVIFWGTLVYVVLQVPYPESLTQATIQQIIFFFLPLFLALGFSFNFFLTNYLLSFAVSLGVIFLLMLQALDSLNLVTGILILTAIYFLFDYFKRIRKSTYKPSGIKNLTKRLKIPKLTKLQ